MCTMQHYSAAKRREALTLTTTWMDLESTMLSERSQTRRHDSIDGKCPEQ